MAGEVCLLKASPTMTGPPNEICISGEFESGMPNIFIEEVHKLLPAHVLLLLNMRRGEPMGALVDEVTWTPSNSNSWLHPWHRTEGDSSGSAIGSVRRNS